MKKFYSLFLILGVLACKKSTFQNTFVSSNRYYEIAFKQLEKKEFDSAFYNFNQAKNIFQKNNDSLGIGKSYMQMAAIQLEQADNLGCQETFVNALNYLISPRDNYYILSIYNNIAIAMSNLKEYENSLQWYRKAVSLSTSDDDIIIIRNNMALVYYEIRDYKNSINILKELLKSSSISKNLNLKSSIIDNLAYAKFLQNPKYNAELELNKALKIRTKENDNWGQNASYAHLSEYFFEKDKAKSLFYAKKMLTIAQKLKSPDDQLESLQKIIPLETPENSKKYFLQYQKLDDSLQTARAKARNQFALIRYETEKSKAENEELKAEAAIKENKLLRKNILVGVLIIGLLFSVFWYQRRRKFLAQREQINIKNTKLKYSKKVHDVVANGIYQVLSEVENKESLDKESLLDKLESIYEKSRDISYENSFPSEKSILLEINELISSFANEDLKILIINDVETWKNTTQKIQSEIKLILQELLVNPKKHSYASFAKISFENEDGYLLLNYFDNGVGFSEVNFEKKNGLQNTESRIFSMQGTITFVKNLEKGSQIKIKIPV